MHARIDFSRSKVEKEAIEGGVGRVSSSTTEDISCQELEENPEGSFGGVVVESSGSPRRADERPDGRGWGEGDRGGTTLLACVGRFSTFLFGSPGLAKWTRKPIRDRRASPALGSSPRTILSITSGRAFWTSCLE